MLLSVLRTKIHLAGLALLVAVSPAAAGGTAVELIDPERAVSLAADWKFRAGDDPAWADPEYDDSGWSDVRVPSGPRSDVRAELSWYRLEIQLRSPDVAPEGGDWVRANLRLGLTLGKIDSAYEVFAGGRRLGGVGSLPPSPAIDYDRHRIYVIPPAAIGPDGRLVIALRVWKSPHTAGSAGSLREGPFLLGRVEDLTRRELVSELPSLFLAAFFAIIGLFHLELFRRQPQLSDYLWFCGCSIAFAGYTFLRTQWKYTLGDHFKMFKEIEYLLLFLMVAGFIQLVWPLLGLRIRPPLRVYQGLNVAAGLLVAVTPGLELNLLVLPYWQISLVVLIVYGSWTTAREAWCQQSEARIVAIGAIGSAIAFLSDIAVDRGLYTAPRIAAFGFAFLVLSLAASLANRFMRTHRELQALRAELEQRVRDRTHQLVEANRSKTRFLATMSHEIRTPLNGVIGATDLLLDTDLSMEQRELAEVARNSGDAVLVLIDDILDFSKIEAGKFELDLRPFRLRDCIEASLDLLAARAAEKGLDLAYAADPEVPAVIGGDGVRLRQILVNLLGNAVKFTEEGGVLLDVGLGQAEASEDRLELYFRVVDTGIGIPPHLLDGLFEAFSQVDDSDTRQHQGSGLGLAISRRLCELMEGRIWAESEPGQGSTFHVSLPVTPETAGDEAFLGPPQSELEGKKVLILERGMFTRQALVDLLEAWGMVPSVTTSARKAAERLRPPEVGQVWHGPEGGQVWHGSEGGQVWHGSGESQGWHGLDGVGGGQAAEAYDVAILGRHAGGHESFLELCAVLAEEQLPWITVKWMAVHDPPPAAAQGFAARLTAPIKPAELHTALLRVVALDPEDLRSVSLPALPDAVPGASDSAPAGGDRPAASVDDRPAPLILLAEDDEVNRTVTLRMLEKLGCPADYATNGLEALEALGRHRYDLVLLDVQMPKLDGLETARRIRARRPRPESPWLIAITANAMRGDREKCLAAGMDDYVSKPLKRVDLQAALGRWQDAVPEAAPASTATPIPAEPDSGVGASPAEIDNLVLDPNVLDSLRELDDGEGDILRETLEVFLGTTPARIDGLDTALATRDLEMVERLAHTLKSSSGMVGGQRMAEVCKRLEHLTRDGTLDEAPELIQRIGDHFADLRAELKPELEGASVL